PSERNIIDVDAEMDNVQSAYPWRGKRPQRNNDFVGNLFSQIQAQTEGLSQISDSEYERYNRERDKYFKQCEVYFSDLRAYQQQCCAELNLFVRNEGGAPAEDVDLLIHFPDGFELYTEDDLPEEPEAPRPPSEPLSTFQQMMH